MTGDLGRKEGQTSQSSCLLAILLLEFRPLAFILSESLITKLSSTEFCILTLLPNLNDNCTTRPKNTLVSLETKIFNHTISRRKHEKISCPTSTTTNANHIDTKHLHWLNFTFQYWKKFFPISRSESLPIPIFLVLSNPHSQVTTAIQLVFHPFSFSINIFILHRSFSYK